MYNLTYNPVRGDVKLELAGGIILRPTFSAIVKLEAHYQKSIFDIARDYAGGQLNRAADLLVFIEAGVEGAGGVVPENLSQQMLDFGLVKLLNPVGTFLAHACGLET